MESGPEGGEHGQRLQELQEEILRRDLECLGKLRHAPGIIKRGKTRAQRT